MLDEEILYGKNDAICGGIKLRGGAMICHTDVTWNLIW